MRFWIACLCFALCASAVAAQPADAPPPRYQELVDFGLAESAAGRFAEARVAFRQAHQLFPNARTLRVIGMVAFELRDYVDAVRHLERALHEPKRALDDEQRFQVSGLLDQAHALVARYTTEALPKDATLIVDARPAVLEPGGVLLLAIGDHRIAVRRQGSAPVESTITVRGGEHAPLPVLLEPAHAAAPVAPPPQAAAATVTSVPEPIVGAPSEPEPGFPVAQTVVIGAGGALVIAGAILLVMGLDDVASVDDAAAGTEWSELQPAYDRAPLLTGLGTGLLALGGVAVVTGGVWLALDSDEEEAGRGIAVRAVARGAF